MRSLGQPLDQINVEQFVVSAYKTVKPIDDATAAGTYGGNDTFFVTPVVPVTHTLDVQWFLDGNPISGETGSTFDASSLDLSPGSYELEVVVTDNTEMVRDPVLRTTWLSETRLWTIEVTESAASLALDAAASYIEGSPAIISPNAVLTAPGFSNFAGGALTISNPAGGSSDRLLIRNQGNGLDQIGVAGGIVSYSGTSIGTFSGGAGTNPLVIDLDADATVTATQALLRSIAFDNVSDAPSTSDRTLTFVLDDGVGGLTAPQSVILSLTVVNDAPQLNTSVAVTLGSIAEDTAAASIAGRQVSSLLAGVSEPDGTALRGIAVVGLTEKLRGTWQYSINAGASWLAFGSPDETTARLLFPANRVLFVPSSNYHGTPQLLFRAWDRSNGLAAGAVASTSGETGGEGAYSTNSKYALLTVSPVNDAPVLNTGVGVTLGSIAEDTPASGNPGKLVSNLLGGVTDVDAGALKGIAVVNLTEKAKGTWEYSLNGGTSWLPLGNPSDAAARLLLPTNRVRFRPGLNYNGSPQLVFRAWDRSNALAAGAVASTVGQTGGAGAYSAATKAAKLTVTPVNDKPVLTLSGSLGYVRNTPPVVLAPNAILADPDSSPYNGGELRVRITSGGGNNNTLAIGSGFTVNGSNQVLQGATVIGTRTSNGVGTNQLRIAFNNNATKAVVQALIRSITYSNIGGSAGTRTIEFTVSDGALSDVRTKTVNVT
jgi:hypothetical protein